MTAIEETELRKQLFQVAFNTNGQDFYSHTYTELIELIQSREATISQQHEREIANKIFIDITTGHELTKISKAHETACSSSQGFMCDCSVLKAAQHAVDKAKERVLHQQSNGEKV